MLHELVKKMREDVGISGAAFSRMVGINRATLLRFERGEKPVSEKVLIEMFEKLEVEKSLVYKMFVLAELMRLRAEFKEESADAQIASVLDSIRDKNMNIYLFFAKKLS